MIDETLAKDQLTHRLISATRTELDRLCAHLKLDEGTDGDAIRQAYQKAADNTFVELVRPVVKSDAPAYVDILRIIYRELRSYSESFDEHWQRVKSIKFWSYTSPVEDMSLAELEEKILTMYKAEYFDLEDLSVTPGIGESEQKTISWKNALRWIPGASGTAAGVATTVGAAGASNIPFMAAAPGAVAGPVGIAAAVVMMGAQMSGPAYRKIIPATVEFMLIGQRINHMPEDD